MTRTSSPSVQMSSLSSPDTRVAALRTLKNDLIGHDERKEAWIRSGVLKPLADVVTSQKEPDTPNKRTNEEREEARLQAIIVVGSLAQGQYERNLYYSFLHGFTRCRRYLDWTIGL